MVTAGQAQTATPPQEGTGRGVAPQTVSGLCPICMDHLSSNSLSLGCSHTMCAMCAARLLAQGFQRCPVCRTAIDADLIRPAVGPRPQPASRRSNSCPNHLTRDAEELGVERAVRLQALTATDLLRTWEQWSATHAFTHALLKQRAARVALDAEDAAALSGTITTLAAELRCLTPQRQRLQSTGMLRYDQGGTEVLDFRPGAPQCLDLPASTYLPALKVFQKLESIGRQLLRSFSCYVPVELEMDSLPGLMDSDSRDYDAPASSLMQLLRHSVHAPSYVHGFPGLGGPPPPAGRGGGDERTQQPNSTLVGGEMQLEQQQQPAEEGKEEGELEPGLLCIVAAQRSAALQVCDASGMWSPVLIGGGEVAVLPGSSLQCLTRGHVTAGQHLVDGDVLAEEAGLVVCLKLRPRAGSLLPGSLSNVPITMTEMLTEYPPCPSSADSQASSQDTSAASSEDGFQTASRQLPDSQDSSAASFFLGSLGSEHVSRLQASLHSQDSSVTSSEDGFQQRQERQQQHHYHQARVRRRQQQQEEGEGVGGVTEPPLTPPRGAPRARGRGGGGGSGAHAAHGTRAQELRPTRIRRHLSDIPYWEAAADSTVALHGRASVTAADTAAAVAAPSNGPVTDVAAGGRAAQGAGGSGSPLPAAMACLQAAAPPAAAARCGGNQQQHQQLYRHDQQQREPPPVVVALPCVEAALARGRGSLTVHLRSIHGRVLTLQLRRGSRVTDMVRRFQRAAGIPPGRVVLLHGGRRLWNEGELPCGDRPLDELGLVDGATVHYVASPPSPRTPPCPPSSSSSATTAGGSDGF